MAIAIIGLYQQDLFLLYSSALNTEVLNFVYIIPLLIAYLTFRRRRVLLAKTSLETEADKIALARYVSVISLFTLSILLYLYGSITSYTLEYHLFSLPFFALGALLLFFGPSFTKEVWFPISLLFLLQPYLLEWIDVLGSNLAWLSSIGAFALLQLFNVQVSFTTQVDFPAIEVITREGLRIPFVVGYASSGLSSQVGFTIFALFIAYIAKGALWKRAGLLLMGYPLLMTLNMLRIAIVVGLSSIWGTGIAELFHLTGGVSLVFIGTMVLLLTGEKLWKVRIIPQRINFTKCNLCSKKYTMRSSFCSHCGTFLQTMGGRFPKMEMAGQTVAMVAVALLFISVQLPAFASATLPTEVDLTEITAEEAKQLLPSINGWILHYVTRDTTVERVLGQDAALILRYHNLDMSENNLDGDIYVSVQISTGRHSWESSLVTHPARFGRPTATVLDLRDIEVLNQPILTGRFFAFQRPGSELTEVVLYWFERAPFKFPSGLEERNVQISIWSITDRLAAAGLISSSDSLLEIEDLYLTFARPVAQFWQPVRSATLIKTGVIQFSSALLVVPIVPIGAVGLWEILKNEGERRKSRKVAGALVLGKERALIEAVSKAQDTGRLSLSRIAIQFELLTGDSIQHQDLKDMLERAEEVGLVFKSVVARDDVPYLVWKRSPTRSRFNWLNK